METERNARSLAARLKWVREKVLGVKLREMADRLTASGAAVTHVTVGRYESDGPEGRVPGADYVEAVARLGGVDAGWLLTGAGTPDGEPDEVDDFVEYALGIVRRVTGATPNATEEEVRALKADVLAAMVKLARAQGMDPARLEEELAKLGGHPSVGIAPAKLSAAAVLSYYELAERAAAERAAGMKEWGVAARIAEEEARERRRGVNSIQDEWEIAEQGHAAVEHAAAWDRERQRNGPTLPAIDPRPEKSPPDPSSEKRK